MEIFYGRNAPGRRRLTLAPAVALVTALVLVIGVGVSGAATTTHNKAQAGGTLTWAIQTNPASLFDAYYFSAEGSEIFSLVQDHILAPGTFGQPTTGAGAVVSKWKATNPTTYVLHGEEGHQVLGRLHPHREGRRLHDEHPS